MGNYVSWLWHRTTNFPILVDDDKFEVRGGFLGLCDVFLHLIDWIVDEKKIRAIVIDKSIFAMVKSHDFKNSRKTSLFPLCNLNTSPFDVLIKKKKISVLKCSFNSGYYSNAYVFVDKLFCEQDGIIKIDGRCLRKNWNLALGIIEVETNRPYGFLRKPSTCLEYWSDGFCFQNGFSLGNHPWKEDDVVMLEVDMGPRTGHQNPSTRTIRFYVNGELQPVSYSLIPSRFKFFLTACDKGDAFEFLSCQRLSASLSSLPNTRVAEPYAVHAQQHDGSDHDKEKEKEGNRERERVKGRSPVLPPDGEEMPNYVARVVEWNSTKSEKDR